MFGDGCGDWWQEDQLDRLKDAVDGEMGSAIVQDKGHFTLQSGEDPALLVKPGAEEVAHPGLLVGMEFHWQLMDIEPLLAEDVWFPAVFDDQTLHLVGAGHVGHRHDGDPRLCALATSSILIIEDWGLVRL